MEPFQDLKKAVNYVETFSGTAQDLKLPISDSLQDPMGMNLAIITDKILAKDFRPNGFIQKEGYRIYNYK